MATATNVRRPTPILKLTRRGRHVLQVTISLLVVVLAALSIAAFGSQQPLSSAVAADQNGTGTYERIVVQPGDTLWGISTRLSQDGDQAVIFNKILTYNDVETSELKVGQVLFIPVAD